MTCTVSVLVMNKHINYLLMYAKWIVKELSCFGQRFNYSEFAKSQQWHNRRWGGYEYLSTFLWGYRKERQSAVFKILLVLLVRVGFTLHIIKQTKKKKVMAEGFGQKLDNGKKDI